MTNPFDKALARMDKKQTSTFGVTATINGVPVTGVFDEKYENEDEWSTKLVETFSVPQNELPVGINTKTTGQTLVASGKSFEITHWDLQSDEWIATLA